MAPVAATAACAPATAAITATSAGPRMKIASCAVASRPYSACASSGVNSRGHSPRTTATTGGMLSPAPAQHASCAGYDASGTAASAAMHAAYAADETTSTG